MPNLSQDPMEDIKRKLSDEIKAPQKKGKVDKEKEKKKQSQSIDY